MVAGRLVDVVDEAWARSFGCDVPLVRTPGVHLVAGGPGFEGYDAILVVRIEDTVLVYCPETIRRHASELLGRLTAEKAFTARTLDGLAGERLARVDGPSWHGFTDAEHFRPAPKPHGVRIHPQDPRLAALRRACGEEQWAEAGFGHEPVVVYGVDVGGQLIAAGNLTPFRGVPSDVGLITRPDHRRRGVARRLVTRMVVDALPVAGVVRYRALTANEASLAVGRTIGFVGRGEVLVARLLPSS